MDLTILRHRIDEFGFVHTVITVNHYGTVKFAYHVYDKQLDGSMRKIYDSGLDSTDRVPMILFHQKVEMQLEAEL